MTKRIPISKARKELADVLACAKRGDRFVVSQHKNCVAAIVPVEDLQLIQELEDRIDRRGARAALRHAEQHGTVSWEDLKDELGL